MTATLGMFQPFDKGLTAIKESMPWPLQCAVVNATVFHLLINDTEGVLGFYLRRATGFTYFGFESLSENEKNIVVRGVLLVMWVTYQFGQVRFYKMFMSLALFNYIVLFFLDHCWS